MVLKLKMSAGASTFRGILFPLSVPLPPIIIIIRSFTSFVWDKIETIGVAEAEAVHYVCSLLSLRDSR